ncbi:MAG: riboflavin synthase [Bdellovibrionales bacterium]|nr:riboflavin synthase [Bdellovibrionales bacterium]
MFTGIIETTATIHRLDQGELVLVNPWANTDVYLGQSIAIDGCCLTISHTTSTDIHFQLSPETVNKTAFSKKNPGQKVNLERSLRAGDRMDGHMVTGHVDTTSQILDITSTSDGESKSVWIKLPKSFQPFVTNKGSISLDGTSLTVNDVLSDRFSVMLVPHTQKVTTWGQKRTGDLLNVEFDVLAKYIHQALKVRSHHASDD